MPKDIVYRLPKSNEDAIVKLQSPPARLIRLRSLQSDPTHFYSKYDVEIKYEEDIWLSRLRPSHVQHFVLMTVDDRHEEGQEIVFDDKTEYHAIMVVINEYEGSQPDELPADIHMPVYFLGYLYVDTAFRSRGWGTKIINEGINWIKQDAVSKGWPSVKFRVTVMDGNDGAVKLYSRLGFKIDGVKVQGTNPDDIHTDISMILETGP